MANKMKKIIVMILVLSLSVSQLGMAASADGGDAELDLNISITGSDTVTEHDEKAGEIVTTTTTTSQWSGTADSGATVTGSGSETEFVSHDDYNGTKLYEGGSSQAQETETLVESSENTEHSSDVLIDESNEAINESSSTGPVTDTVTSEWVEGGLSQDNDWVEGELQQGEFVEDESRAQASESRDAADIDAPENVRIDLTPGKEKTVTRSVAVKQVIEANVDLPVFGSSTSPITDSEGNVIGEETVEIVPVKNEKGDITGYEKTSTTTHYGQPSVTVIGPDEAGITDTGSRAVDPGLPQQYQPGTVDVLDEEGNVVGSKKTEAQPIVDEKGNVVGYTVTITTTTNNEQLELSQPAGEGGVSNAAPIVSISLPQRPEESESSENGVTTTVSVEDIIDPDSGEVIGYEVITVRCDDESGMELFRGSEKQYGTVSRQDISTDIDPTRVETLTDTVKTTVETIVISGSEQTRNVELVSTRLNEYVNEVMIEKEYDFVEIDGKLYFVYTGSMSVSEGANHGDTSGLIPIAPQSSYVSGARSSDDLYYKSNAGSGNYSTSTNSGKTTPEDEFKLVGNGMASNLVVGTAKGSTIVHQFKLKSDDGTVFYAYCVDMATSARPGYFYELVDISSQDYYQTESGETVDDSVEKIRAIALNGFWGSKSGVGSMDSVEQLVRDYLINEKGWSEAQAKAVAEDLTPGQALAATQAALWKYGSMSDESRVNESDLLKYYYNGGNYNSLSNNSEDYKYTEYIYKALLDSADKPVAANEGVEMLDREDVKAGSITVNSKIEDSSANSDSNVNNDIYSTDISFTLGIEPAKLGGDLKVTVKVGDRVVRTARLDTADSLFSIGIDPDGNGVYTIKNVELAEGVKVNINLSGTQELGTGVYVYTSQLLNNTPSQTMVGLASGERSVDLNISMKFNVDEPEATVVSGEILQQGSVEASRLDTQSDVRTDSKLSVATTVSSATSLSGNINTKYYADVSVTTLTTDTTVTERSWEENWVNYFAPDPVPYNDDFGEDDPEDPTAVEAPKTGDERAMLAAVSLGALVGLLLLRRKKEEAEEA